MGARVLYFIVFRTPANFQFVGRGGSAASQTRMRVSSCKPLPTRCACYFIMVICASVFAENWGWRSATERTPSIAPEESPLWGVSAIHRTKSSSLVPLAWFSMSRLPKHFCAHWSQHLPCRCFSLFIAPEWYSGAFSRKSTFLKIFLLIYLSYTLPSSAERRAGEDRENSGTTPRLQKVLFVNICHRYWLFSARGYPREFPSVLLPLCCYALQGPLNGRQLSLI